MPTNPTQKRPRREVPTESQGELALLRPPGGSDVYLHFVKEEPNLAGFYEGDLVLSAEIGSPLRFDFRAQSLPACFITMLEAFSVEINDALALSEPADVAKAAVGVYSRYACYGIELHRAAAGTICCDPSRLTTALGFVANYLFTLLDVCRHVLGDGSGDQDQQAGVIKIDRNLGGLQSWDGAGVDWGYSTRSTITSIPRTDLSRGRQYLAAQHDVAKDDSRLNDLMALLAGNESSLHSHVPNAIYGPLADAFRGQVKSIVLKIAEAAAVWGEKARTAHREKEAETEADE